MLEYEPVLAVHSKRDPHKSERTRIANTPAEPLRSCCCRKRRLAPREWPQTYREIPSATAAEAVERPSVLDAIGHPKFSEQEPTVPTMFETCS